jgi:ankyrin repeat protein
MNIFEAIERNNIQKVKELLDLGVDVNSKNQYGRTPLYAACDYEYIDIVKLLLAHPDIDVTSKTNYGDTALSIACVRYNIEIVKFLNLFNNILKKNIVLIKKKMKLSACLN